MKDWKPKSLLYFEDFQAGMVFELGERVLSKEEIVAFAAEYDPQPFHVDEEAAEESAFGGLIASGWHTASVFMRLYVDALLTVLDTASSERNPNRGTVHIYSEVLNQHGDAVMTMKARGLFARHGTAHTSPGSA